YLDLHDPAGDLLHGYVVLQRGYPWSGALEHNRAREPRSAGAGHSQDHPAMTQVLSGTYNFSPGLGECVLNAFSRIGVRRTEILQTHLADARMEANLLLAKFGTKQPNLWAVDLQG